jgi:phosphoserine phosphatase
MDYAQSNVIKPLLILDLDETLIHACLSDRGREADLNFRKLYGLQKAGIRDFFDRDAPAISISYMEYW